MDSYAAGRYRPVLFFHSVNSRQLTMQYYNDECLRTDDDD